MAKEVTNLGKQIKGRKAGRAAALTRKGGRQDQPQSTNSNKHGLPTVVQPANLTKVEKKDRLPSRDQVQGRGKHRKGRK
jgi:hypothetical protein